MYVGYLLNMHVGYLLNMYVGCLLNRYVGLEKAAYAWGLHTINC